MQHIYGFGCGMYGRTAGRGTIHHRSFLAWGLLIGIVWGMLYSPPSAYANSGTSDSVTDAVAVVTEYGESGTHTLRPAVRERSAPVIAPTVAVEMTVGPRYLPSTSRARGNYVEVITAEPGRGIPYAPPVSASNRGRFIPRERR